MPPDEPPVQEGVPGATPAPGTADPAGEAEAPAAPAAGTEPQAEPSGEGAGTGVTGEPAAGNPDEIHRNAEGIVEDPVEILVNLAERGEIDPWNINIIEVTDRFLSELERCRQLNLQLSGRTLFFAATLLRMKSEQLEMVDEPEDAGDGEDYLFGGDMAPADGDAIDFGAGRLGPIERLEHEIQRRLDRKNMRKSPITLFELITELKNIEKEERRRRRMSADPGEAFLIDADDVVGIAHEEGFQESAIETLEEYLRSLDKEEEKTLIELCGELGWGIPEVFIPLLFLALDGRCSLRQEEFFGDVFVQVCRAGDPENETLQESA
jgi:segregation and condensation protein A